MNTYLYAWHTDEYCTISKVIARNYEDCENKIKSEYTNEYEDLDDLLDFDEFCGELANNHGIYIGDIFEINEFI